MEIKGLAASFQNAKKRIAEAREATGKFDQTVGAFVASLEDVTTQVDAMHSDLKFEAETLGNSTSQTGSGTAVGVQPGETAHLPKAEGA